MVKLPREAKESDGVGAASASDSTVAADQIIRLYGIAAWNLSRRVEKMKSWAPAVENSKQITIVLRKQFPSEPSIETEVTDGYPDRPALEYSGINVAFPSH